MRAVRVPSRRVEKVRTPGLLAVAADPEFKALIPPLAPEERARLEANIVADGCRDPLVVWRGRGLLVDGHNRLEICTRLRIPYKIVQKEFADRGEALLWIEQNQLGRRNLSPDQRAALAYRVLCRRVAGTRSERAANAGRRKGAVVSISGATVTSENRPRVREVVAGESGVTERALRRVQAIANVDPATVERIIRGEITIQQAEKNVRWAVRAELSRRQLPLKIDGWNLCLCVHDED